MSVTTEPSAEERAAEAEWRLLAQEVASENGIPLRHAGRLHGSTREELEADAEQFIATMAEEYTARRPRTNANAADEGLGRVGMTMNAWIRKEARGLT